MQAQRLPHLHVLVGRGHNSPGNVAKVALMVAEVCEELRLRFVVAPGKITIALGDDIVD